MGALTLASQKETERTLRLTGLTSWLIQSPTQTKDLLPDLSYVQAMCYHPRKPTLPLGKPFPEFSQDLVP